MGGGFSTPADARVAGKSQEEIDTFLRQQEPSVGGKTSIYFRNVALQPTNYDTPPPRKEDGLTYACTTTKWSDAPILRNVDLGKAKTVALVEIRGELGGRHAYRLPRLSMMKWVPSDQSQSKQQDEETNKKSQVTLTFGQCFRQPNNYEFDNRKGQHVSCTTKGTEPYIARNNYHAPPLPRAKDYGIEEDEWLSFELHHPKQGMHDLYLRYATSPLEKDYATTGAEFISPVETGNRLTVNQPISTAPPARPMTIRITPQCTAKDLYADQKQRLVSGQSDGELFNEQYLRERQPLRIESNIVAKAKQVCSEVTGP